MGSASDLEGLPSRLSIEYGQRLHLRRRNVATSAAEPDLATHLWRAAVRGGAQAAARPIAGLAEGQRADFVELDGQCTALAGLDAPGMLATHVFAASRRPTIGRVVVGGAVSVEAGRHSLRDEAGAAFVRARRQLMQRL